MSKKSVMISFRLPLNSLGFEWITALEAEGKNVSDEIRSLIHKEVLENNLPLHQAYMIKAWRHDMLMDYMPYDIQEQFNKWLKGVWNGHETEVLNQSGRSFHELSSKEKNYLHPANKWKKTENKLRWERDIKSGHYIPETGEDDDEK